MSEFAVVPFPALQRRVLWIVLGGMSCLVLVAGAFVLGRATDTTHSPTIRHVTRAVVQHAPVGAHGYLVCHGFGPC